jgi:D-tyrosyl-tRNA(Tyr) deacylase
MKAILQRVSNAMVSVNSTKIANIGMGYLILLGIEHHDTLLDAKAMVLKIQNLRLFPNQDGKFDQSLLDINGDVLVVSQFTLMADCSKGRRPNFLNAAPPNIAQPLLDQTVGLFKEQATGKVETGLFGADMAVTLTNDGPVTIYLDSNTFVSNKNKSN